MKSEIDLIVCHPMQPINNRCLAAVKCKDGLAILEPIPINDKATRYKGGGDTRQNDGAGNGLGVGRPGDQMATLNYQNPVRVGYVVRRLTPVETERLMGLLDGYAEWGINKKGVKVYGSDSARYKAIGNSMVRQCANHPIQGIKQIFDAEGRTDITLGSLFDGIGVFPLVAVENGIRPVWASEIEPYPIAVSRRHFGGE
jgi:site-specific DNA-cytosine methylase